jgi:hypothetical protein
MSRGQITNLVQELRDVDHVLTAHPTLTCYYTFTDQMAPESACDGSKMTSRPVQDIGPAVQDLGEGVQDFAITVQDFGCEEPAMCRKCHNSAVLRNNTEGVTCNIYSNETSKQTRKVTFSSPASASPAQDNCCGSELSAGAKTLLEAIHHYQCASGRKETLVPQAKRKSVTPDQLPYDDISSTKHELPYDIVVSRAIEIKNAIQWVKQYWRTFKVRYDKKDIANFTRLFVANPRLTLKHWQEIEYYIGSAQLEHHWFDEACRSAPGRARTASARLYLLPQIIHEMNVWIENHYLFEQTNELRAEDLSIEGTIPEPYASLDFSVLDEVAENALWRVVPPPLKFVDQDHNPMTMV